jgi:hypothetical protein
MAIEFGLGLITNPDAIQVLPSSREVAELFEFYRDVMIVSIIAV